MVNHHIFSNLELQQKFDEQGFVKFPFLSDDQQTKLKALYAQKLPKMQFSNGLHISVDMFSTEEKGVLKQELMEIIGPSFENDFQPVSQLHQGFIIKQARSVQNEISVHQDWTFVAEDQGIESGTLWIAVNDVPKERGGIGFVAGSHKWLHHTRYTPMELAFNPINAHRELLAKHLVFEDLKAGEAVLWNHRTLHGSVANRSDEDRLVVAMSLIPEFAQLKLHYQLPTNENAIGIFDVDLEFYQRHKATDFHNIYSENRNPEGLTPVSTYPLERKEFDAEKLAQALAKGNSDLSSNLNLFVEDSEAKSGITGWISKLIYGANASKK